jgi:tyrosyl-tRNA synthetase
MSPYAFYQFWINRADSEVGSLLRVFTFRSRGEIEELERETAERPAARGAQRVLAQDVTTLVHGSGEYDRAVAASRALFGQGELRDLDEKTLTAALAEVPSATVDAGALRDGQVQVADLMAETGIVASKSAARRAITEGGAYLNNVKVTMPDAVPGASDLLHGKFLVLRRGKRTVGGVEARPPQSG